MINKSIKQPNKVCVAWKYLEESGEQGFQALQHGVMEWFMLEGTLRLLLPFFLGFGRSFWGVCPCGGSVAVWAVSQGAEL